jgi:hypothetical protein
VSRDFDDDDLVDRLRAHDPVAGWTPDREEAFKRLATAEPELFAASEVTAPDGTIEVRIGDLAVVHTVDGSARRRRTTSYAAIVATAAAIALVVALIPQLLQSGGDTKDRLAVTASRPSTAAKPVPAPAPVQPAAPASVRPRVKQSAPTVSKGHSSTATAVPSAAAPPPPPPAPLSVTMSLSATEVHAGNSVTVNYSWTDGSGQLLYLNHIGISASKFVRLLPCGNGSAAPKPSSGHGSWVFTLPLGEPMLIEGVSSPFDHPERIKVGVQIGTGGKCGPVEEKTVTQWLTIYPARTG